MPRPSNPAAFSIHCRDNTPTEHTFTLKKGKEKDLKKETTYINYNIYHQTNKAINNRLWAQLIAPN